MQKNQKSRLFSSLLESPKKLLIVGAVVLVVLGIVGYLQLQTPSALTVEKAEHAAAEDASSDASPVVSSGIMVDVSGAVKTPGMYTLTMEDPRVNDAVQAAGGLTENADTQSINLAQKIQDGEKVYIPKVGDASATTASAPASASSNETSGADTSRAGLVNINTATVEQLQTLPGVGEATAKAIVKDREQNGKFKSKQDLMRVSGIGEKKYAKLEGSICV